MLERGELLPLEANEVNARVDMVARLSNLALQLYCWYIKNGHARNLKDEKGVKKFLQNNLPPNAHSQTGFYERLYLYTELLLVCIYSPGFFNVLPLFRKNG